jgi:hypothetical protein
MLLETRDRVEVEARPYTYNKHRCNSVPFSSQADDTVSFLVETRGRRRCGSSRWLVR